MLLAGIGMLAVAVPSAHAQSARRSTTSGVYTEAQAARGRDTFAGMCQACHTPATHTGPTFIASWGNRPLWELFDYLMANMPKSDPGSLSPEEYAQVLAYVLKMNGMPAGSRELPADEAALRAIRLEAAGPKSNRAPVMRAQQSHR
jgi:mono/diheme cytochrome c family protein